MGRRSILLWNALERWKSSMFLLAGSLLLVATAINAIDVFTPIATQEGLLLSIEGATGFGGAILFFVGLLGIYPLLADAEPLLARVGLLFAAGPAIFFSVLLVVCSVLAPLLGFSSLETAIPSFALIAGTIAVLYATSLVLLGVCSLRTAVPSRSVGGLLLVVALAWFGSLGAILVYQYQTPTWVTFLQTALMAVPTVTIGFHLRMMVEPTSNKDPSAGPAV